MGNGWTLERKRRQAKLIRQWRPWEQATGPRTPEGKGLVSRNAYKGGVLQQLHALNTDLNREMAAMRELNKMALA
jgi:hypothetical protein